MSSATSEVAESRLDAQARYWESTHRNRLLQTEGANASPFAMTVAQQESQPTRILELGCGLGHDARYFSNLGHTVVAVDISPSVIQQNRRRHRGLSLEFINHDIRQPFQSPDSSFDAVYARLSLHYFSDRVTRQIVVEIARILRPGGHFYFMCKSTSDPLYGRGTRLAHDTYEIDGHVRHFFSVHYARSLLMQDSQFGQHKITLGEGILYGYQSAFLMAFAVKAA